MYYANHTIRFECCHLEKDKETEKVTTVSFNIVIFDNKKRVCVRGDKLRSLVWRIQNRFLFKHQYLTWNNSHSRISCWISVGEYYLRKINRKQKTQRRKKNKKNIEMYFKCRLTAQEKFHFNFIAYFGIFTWMLFFFSTDEKYRY